MQMLLLAFLRLLLVKNHPAASRQSDTKDVVALTENVNNVMVLKFISELLRHCIIYSRSFRFKKINDSRVDLS